MSPEEHIRAALAALDLGDDPELRRTPELFTELLREFQPQPPPPVSRVQTTSTDLVIVRALPFHSLCAHHLLPFFGTATIAIRPSGQLAGLGWYARVLHALARRPQLQERLADQLAGHLFEELGATSVGVHLQARQMCVEMRGARTPGQYVVRALRGQPDAELSAALSPARTG